jgi:hypothetical protein
MVQEKVQVPAVGLMVAAGLDALFAVVIIFLSILGISMIDMPTLAEHPVDRAALENLISGGFLFVICVAGLIIDAIIAYGAIKMMKLESYGWAVASAILAIIPCLSSPCIALGLPFGIWALAVLMNQQVRSGFLQRETPAESVEKSEGG